MRPIEPISASPPHSIRRPAMRQTWTDVTFLHWRYNASVVRPLVPRNLELDLWEGSAWIGLVPFYITGLTRPNALDLPWLSHFPETNVRTYVIDRNGGRGVWFFSLDAARLAAVIAARSVYALPYYWARMRVARDGASVHYSSERRLAMKGSSDIEIQIGEALPEPAGQDIFLTARFRLYAERLGQIRQAGIEHQPWPLQRASAVRIRQDLVQAGGLPAPDSDPLVHFAARVDVMVAWPSGV